MAERVLIAMSGGVDSSVAAANLVDQGFEVFGVTLHLWDEPEDGRRGRCCAPEDVYDARRVADQLGFRHYSLDRRAVFQKEVVEPFVDSYLNGWTPSPCSTCNRLIKFPSLLRLANLTGSRWVATGHYARILRDSRKQLRIGRGLDRSKDQAYFLYSLGQSTLERLLLPLGERTKAEVRKEALSRGLSGAQKGESQDLCFVDGPSYAEFVEKQARSRIRPGQILDDSGKVVGNHAGIHRFTPGQRKGLGIASIHPLFVTGINPKSASITVGREQALMVRELRVRLPVLAPLVPLPCRAQVRIRYRHEGAPATLNLDGDELRVVFDEPVRAASPGQVAVAFDEDLVVGGGIISDVVR